MGPDLLGSQHQSALTAQGLQLHGTQGQYWADHKNRHLEIVSQAHGFEQVNPNFFKPYPDWDDPSKTEWVGYGYDSIKQGLDDVRTLLERTEGLPKDRARAVRQEMIDAWEKTRPLPNQALVGTAVNEAVRLSIAHGNAWVGFGEGLRAVLL